MEKRQPADRWPPVIDSGDIGLEIAIAALAVLSALFAEAHMLTAFTAMVALLFAAAVLYVRHHVRKRRPRR